MSDAEAWDRIASAADRIHETLEDAEEWDRQATRLRRRLEPGPWSEADAAVEDEGAK